MCLYLLSCIFIYTNACSYSLYIIEALNNIVLDAVNQLHSTILSMLTIKHACMHSLFTRAWDMYTMCTLKFLKSLGLQAKVSCTYAREGHF